jgi:hypothetical protein
MYAIVKDARSLVTRSSGSFHTWAAALIALTWMLPVTAADAQVVIRERVEVKNTEPRPEAHLSMDGFTSMLETTEDCSLPVVGYAVYWPERGLSGSTYSGGAHLTGTLDVATICGGASSGIRHGFDHSSTWEKHFHGEDRFNYNPIDSVEVLRVPLRVHDDLLESRVTVWGTTRTFTTGFSSDFGCGYNSCSKEPPRGASLGMRRRIEGHAALIAGHWPEEITCGEIIPLPIRAIKRDGDEGWIGRSRHFTYRIPSSIPRLQYKGTISDRAEVPYVDGRSGVPHYVAPQCIDVTDVWGQSIWVTHGSLEGL